MAPHKQPESLFDLSHKRYVSLVFNSCVGIEQRHGTFDSEECVQAVHDLQNVLVSAVPSFMWNKMCEHVLLLIDNYDNYAVEARFVAARKIAYGIFANERLTHIKFISGYFCGPNMSSLRGSSLYKLEKSFVFWEKIFKNLSNVTKIVFSPSGLHHRLTTRPCWTHWGCQKVYAALNQATPARMRVRQTPARRTTRARAMRWTAA